MIRLLGLTLLLALLAACGNDDDELTQDYNVPDTYNFDNVSYDGQTQRLDMLAELSAYTKAALNGIELDSARLQAMYRHADGAAFAGNYEDSKQLRDKTREDKQDLFDALLGVIYSVSRASGQAAIPGTAGTATTADGKQYLLNQTGVEYAQIIEKGLMGACFLHQATAVYMGASKMNVDNTTIEPGEGTAMEHHWDEAFGYLGVSPTFPANTDDIRFWGKYVNTVDPSLGSNRVMMDAFLKGRAAISNDDLETRDQQIAILRSEWERVAAANAIHYLNIAKTDANFSDRAKRCHALSEAVAFLYGVQFVPGAKIDATTYDEIQSTIGGTSQFGTMSFDATNQVQLQRAVDDIAAIYELESVKEAL